MNERDGYTYIPLAKFDSTDHTVLTWLVERDRLPRDILVRADVQGDDTYEALLNEAVLAALNEEPLPAFVSKPLPNAFTLFLSGRYERKNSLHPLAMLEEDYHQFSTLYRLAESHDLNPNLMFTVWQRLLAEIQTDLALEIEDERTTTPRQYSSSRAGQMLWHTIIKDAPTFEVYQDTPLHPKLYRGIGRRCLVPLGYMLADNHPEIIEQVEKMEDAIDK